MKKFLFAVICTFSLQAMASDFLVKIKPIYKISVISQLKQLGKLETVDDQWMRLQTDVVSLPELRANYRIEYAQLNFKLHLIENYKNLPEKLNKVDPEIPSANVPAIFGIDPLISKQWGMKNIHATDVWPTFAGDKKVIVAVIDTGVDYTHEDLVANMWHNTGEIPDNGIDDDGNGFIDDEIGWDFLGNDNKPYDTTGTGNPGHGTHCAGNIGAVGNNDKGISGVAPRVSIMALRFIGEDGSGTTADAIKAIDYAVNNGAKILSNSWGDDSEDPANPNVALQDAITNAMKKDVLFIAAAGNSQKNNDTDAHPTTPASYNMDNIISVAALGYNDKLASFSCYGFKTVDVGAPGVKVFSTVVGGKYSDTISGGYSWSGTSMAAPHVAGAAAMVWAAHPNYKWSDVKKALLSTVDKIPSLDGKILTGGKINVSEAIK